MLPKLLTVFSMWALMYVIVCMKKCALVWMYLGIICSAVHCFTYDFYIKSLDVIECMKKCALVWMYLGIIYSAVHYFTYDFYIKSVDVALNCYLVSSLCPICLC